MKKIKDIEHKKLMIDMLEYIDKICRKNNIKYTLEGGTLLGAIRHGGMIPWDDDVDISLDKNNYSRLIDVLTKEKGRYQLLTRESNNTYYLPFVKLIDTNTIAYEFERRDIDNYGVFIDIFSYHNMPNNKIVRKIHYARLKLWQNLIFGYSKTKIKGRLVFLKKIRKKIVDIFGIEYALKKYNKALKKYDKQKTKYLILSWPVYKYKNSIFPSNIIEGYDDILFNGINTMISKEYDILLKTNFGDYMTLPPVEERIPQHSIEIYWRK